MGFYVESLWKKPQYGCGIKILIGLWRDVLSGNKQGPGTFLLRAIRGPGP